MPFAKFLMPKCQKESCSKRILYFCSVVARSDQFRNLCPKASDVRPKASDVRQKASDEEEAVRD